MPMILGGDGTVIGGKIAADANGNIGVNNSSPVYRIDVNAGTQGTTANSQVLMQRFYTSAGNSNYLEITDTRVSSGSFWNGCGARIQHKVDSDHQAYIQFNGGNDYGIAFGTGVGSSGPTSVPERMRIDGSGRITTPNQPFSAYYYADPVNRTTTGFNVRFQTKRISRGTDGYNSSTGAYTAPVSGVYGFTWAYLYANMASTAQVDDGYAINGTAFYGGNRYTGSGYYGDGYIGVKGAVNVYLNQNDTFAVYSLVSNDASYNLYQNDFWGYYTAALIG